MAGQLAITSRCGYANDRLTLDLFCVASVR